MARYYRDDGYKNQTTYYAVSDTPTKSDRWDSEYPAAEMTVTKRPTQFHKIWSDTPMNKGQFGSLDQRIEAATGLDASYVRRFAGGVPGVHEYISDESALSNLEDWPEIERGETYAERLQKTKEDRDKSLDTFRSLDIANPETLFDETPGYQEITGAYADPSMKAHVPVLGSMAHLDAGQDLVADYRLSHFSSKLTQNAVKRGLPVVTHPWNPEAETSGEDPDHHLPRTVLSGFTDRLTPINPEQVSVARKHLRTMLRGPRTEAPKSQPVSIRQPLPGMEKYL